MKNKAILEQANAAIAEGNTEGFLSFCSDDTEWTYVGDRTLKGKEAVRQYLATAYLEPPNFTVTSLIAEGDFVTALGDIILKDENGKAAHHSYCDVWRFRGGKLVELRAFVTKTEAQPSRSNDEKNRQAVNKTDGYKTLEAAIRAGDLAAATDFVRSGVDVNRCTPEGLTPLMVASGLGQSQMVGLLLTAGAQVLAVEPRAGATALHKAALSGNADVVGLLLDHGAFIDQQSPILGHTALLDAVVYKHEAVVRLLLKRGARTAITNHWHETALAIAQRDGLDAIAHLIEARNKADEEEVRAQPLVPAIKAGDLAAVKRLIAAGADVNARLPMVGSPDDDYTPLAIAAREGHADIVRALLAAGANPRRVIGLFLGTALHEACYFGYTDVIQAMTEERERADSRASELDAQGAYNGFTPLHDAVWHGHLEAARALVEAGAPLHLRTHAGLTPRELAIHYGYDNLARLLADSEQARATSAPAAIAPLVPKHPK